MQADSATTHNSKFLDKEAWYQHFEEAWYQHFAAYKRGGAAPKPIIAISITWFITNLSIGVASLKR
jgi:hypothetical protein